MFSTSNVFFSTFLVTETVSVSEIKMLQARMYSMPHMRLGHENKQIGRKLQKIELLCAKWMESCPQLSHNFIIAV